MIKLDAIADEWNRALQSGQAYAENVLYDLLICGLPPRQRQALIVLAGDPEDEESEPVTSAEVAEALDIGQNHACNILNRLRELHLARREQVIGDDGMRYDWYCHSRWIRELA